MIKHVLDNWDEGDATAQQKTRMESSHATLSQNVEIFAKFEEELTSKWTPINNRVFSRVRYAPPEGLANDTISPLAGSHPALPWYRDYCLLELTGSKSPGSRTPSNTVTDTTRLRFGDKVRAASSAELRQSIYHFNVIRSFKLQDIIPISVLEGGGTTMYVNKVGSSGIIGGISFPGFSAINHGGQVFKAWSASPGTPFRRFTDTGDSGALIFVHKYNGPPSSVFGSVGGMVIGGARGNDPGSTGLDITYSTPMEWILDDLKKNGFDVGLLQD